MITYPTQFSCLFDVGTAENAARAVAIRQEHADALERAEDEELGFALELSPDDGPGTLWISSDDDGEPEHVITFVLACAEAFDLQGRWGFTWALTCSQPRLDGFGGGAQLLDLGARKSLAWMDCELWLKGMLDPETDPSDGMAFT